MPNYCLFIEQTCSDILKEIKYKYAIKINNLFCSSWNHRNRGHISRSSTWGRTIANTRLGQLWLYLAKSWKTSKDKESTDSLGNVFQDCTTFPLEKFFLMSNLNLLQVGAIGTCHNIVHYQEEGFFYQYQYNLPVVFFQCHLWQSASQGRDAFLLGMGMVQECPEVRSMVSTCSPKISYSFWMSSRHFKSI